MGTAINALISLRPSTWEEGVQGGHKRGLLGWKVDVRKLSPTIK